MSDEVQAPQNKTFFEYGDYRELLKNLFEQNKLKNKRFSYRYFSKQAGFVSHSFLQFVIAGRSHLSEDSIEKIIKGFKMNKEEGHFFRHLVLFNQAKTAEEKQFHAQEIMSLKSYKKIRPLSEAQYNFCSTWYFIPIRELVGLPGFREDPQWIATQLIPNITPDQARKALADLETLGMLVRDQSGRLKQAERFLSTADEVASSAIVQWHREMMKKASESIDRIPREQRDISSVTVRLSQENLKKVKEFIHNFRKDLINILSEDSNSDAVYELNLQLFPLTKFTGGGPHEGSK